MPIITLKTEIHAPIERCFDLARSIDLHQLSTAGTRERAVGGVTSGLLVNRNACLRQAAESDQWKQVLI
jgi:hypothetical protein